MKPKLLIFASGTKAGGGSGFENLVQASRKVLPLDSARGISHQECELDADIVGVVSNHEHGGVRERADRIGVPFIYFPGPYTAENYRSIVAKAMGTEPAPLEGGASLMGWVMLSGWLKFVHGLDPARTFNIHPALLSFDHGRFGGAGMYGHRIQEAVKVALEAGEIAESGCSMHFVTEEYDRGPVFFEFSVPLQKGMSADDIAKLVNKAEHQWQPKITNMVVHEEIRWDGKDLNSLVVPEDYKYFPQK